MDTQAPTSDSSQSPPSHVQELANLQFLHCRPAQEERLVRLEDIVECIPMVQLDENHGVDNPRYRGLLHFRGRVVPVVDLFADEHQPLELKWFLLVLRSGAQEIALVVREVFQISTYDAGNCERVHIGPVDTLTVVSSDSQMLQVVEPDTLLNI